MPVLADDEMIVNRYAEWARHRDDCFPHLNVGLGWRRIARWMIVHQDDGAGRQFERALDHLARIDRRVIDGAGLLHFIGDELIALIEKQYSELLAVGEALSGAAIVEHARPR